MAKSITSANAQILFSVPLIFPTPQPIQGFAADDIFSTDPQEEIETSMGMDGELSAGFMFKEVKYAVSLQANSRSMFIFDTLHDAQRRDVEAYPANMLIVLPGLKLKGTFTKGFMTSYPPMPDAGKTLKFRKFGFTWESLVKGPA